MLGAIIGDIAGSRFEFDNYRKKDFELFAKDCFFTDDSVMTLAVAKAIMETERQCARSLNEDNGFCDALLNSNTVKYMREIGRNYPDCGYGGRFMGWMFSDHPLPYNSFGNGSAMRVGAAGWAARTEEEAVVLSEIVTSVTHNHPEGVKGAEATAVAIFMARGGATREQIRFKIESGYYPLDFRIDSIRDTYRFNETCQETVPQAIEAFLESTSFEDAIRIAVSVGGDSDTLAAITGSIAEAYYGVPDALREKALTFLDDRLRTIYMEWEAFTADDPCRQPYHVLTKYISHWETAMRFDERLEGLDDWASYDELKDRFIHEFDAFIKDDLSYDSIGPFSMVKKYCHCEELDEAYGKLSSYDADVVMRLIWVYTHSDCYCEGLAESFYKNGKALACLKRLKALSMPEGELEYVEMSTTAFLSSYNYACRMSFSDNGAILTINHMGDEQKTTAYAAREAADWQKAYRAIHTEHWYSSYTDRFILDGAGWRVVEKRKGMRETVWEGYSIDPVNYDWLATLMGIDDGMRVDDEHNDWRLKRNPAPSAISELELVIDNYYSEKNGDNVSRSETISINRSEGGFRYACQSDTASHASSWIDRSKPLDLALWAAQFCLATPGWNEKKTFAQSGAHRTYRLTVRYDDGAVSERSGCFFRDHLPKSQWKTLLYELSVLRGQSYSSQALDGDALLYADADGSARYASVVFDGEQRSFYYLNRLDGIYVGTRVRVPFGAENKQRVGTVKEMRRYDAGEYPFPIRRTKEIIAKIDTPKDDEE